MSTSDKINVGASIPNDDDVCEMNDVLRNMSTADKDIDVSICANCGKEGNSDNMNTCNKCKQVKYCNAVCKKVHKKKHKKGCEEYVRLAAEHAAELHDIELFKQPPPREDCPICFIRLPDLRTGRSYQSCCGKEICSGCVDAPVYDNQGNEVDNEKCPFCRLPAPNEEEMIKRLTKRMEASDALAIYNLGCYYDKEMYRIPQNYTKALELWHRAAEHGCAEAYCNIGSCYDNGEGVEVDKEKANYYCELAAIGGDVQARHNLGIDEARSGNINRAVKHFMIATSSGDGESLKMVQKMYSNGHATKEDYTEALQSYQVYLGEIKSVQRDKVAAADEDYRYY